MPSKLLIFGGSGHAKDVLDAAKAIGYEKFQFVTTDGSCDVAGYTAIKEADLDLSAFSDWPCIVAIGNNDHRRRIQETYSELQFTTIISPTAFVSTCAEIGPGSYIGTFCHIGPDTKIEKGTIINTHTTIGHDVEIGNYTHICPQVSVAGNVGIGQQVYIGSGVTINNGLPGAPLTVADKVNVGMGSIITHSLKTSGCRVVPKPNFVAVRPE